MPTRALVLRSLTALLAPALFLLLEAAPASARQGRSVEWAETTRLELPGTLGAFLQALPGLSAESESRHALYSSGRILATSDGSTTTILDMEERRWVAVDHDSRSYVSMSFEESSAVMRESLAVMAEARAGAEEALRESEAEREAAMAEMRAAMEEAQAQFDVRVDVETTGETRTIEGLRAQRHFLTAEIESRGGVDGVEGTDEGTLAFVMELWQSDEFPSADDLYREWAEAMAGDPALQGMAREMAESVEPQGDEANPWEALALWNPGVAAGLGELAESLEALDGTTVASVTHVAFVPTGVDLDREALMAWEPESMGDQIRQGAGAAAADAARSAVRGLGRGLFGRGGGDDEPEEEAPAVRPLMRLTQQKGDIRVGPVDGAAAVFQIPEGYQQRALPVPGATPPPGSR